MTNLNELIVSSNYYKAKHEYLEMKIAKIKKLQLACGSPIETECKQYVADVITKEPIQEVEPDTEPESDTESGTESDTYVSLFFKDKIVKDSTGKIKRSDFFDFYKKYCLMHKLDPKPKTEFFVLIEKLIGQPIKTNGLYYYKNYSFRKSDPILTFNETVDTLIF